jgi:flagellar basal body-associated protein FliL
MAHLEVKRKRRSWWLWLIIIIIVIAVAAFCYQRYYLGSTAMIMNVTTKTAASNLVITPVLQNNC